MKRHQPIQQSLALLLVVLQVGLTLPRSVHAAAGTRLGVSTLWAPEIAPDQKLKILKQLGDEFQIASRRTVVRDPQVIRQLEEFGRKGQSERDSLEQAARSLKEGKQAYLNLDMDTARIKLEETRKLLILNLHKLENNDALLQSHLYLGMVYVATYHPDLAIEEFRKVAFLDPDLELSTKQYSPDIVSAFQNAKQAVDRETQASLLFESAPDKAKLFINGKLFGETPVNLTLPVGEYFFRLTKTGYRDWYQVMKVDEGFEKVRKNLAESLSEEEESAELFRTVSRDYPATPRLVERLTEQSIALQADVLLLGEIRQGKESSIQAQWFDARTQQFSPAVAIKGRGDVTTLTKRLPLLARSLLEQISDNGYVLADKSLNPKVTQGPQSNKDTSSTGTVLSGPQAGEAAGEAYLKATQEQRRPWYKKWWIWGILAGAGAAAAGVAILTDGSGKNTIIIDNGGNVPAQ